ncbi:hypothetical protein Taro_027792, partial [Colocasia esculenta]|nr:hypothetical protein [Colocasia esculenta]
VGQTEPSQALLGQGRLLQRFFGRFDDLAVLLACSRREDVVWSVGNTVWVLFFTFFTKVGRLHVTSWAFRLSVVWEMTGLVATEVPVWQTDLSGCRGAQGGRVLVTVWAAVVIRFVSRHPAPSRSGGRKLKALSGSPSSFFPLFLLSSPLRGGEASPLSSLAVGARGGAAVACAEWEQRWQGCPPDLLVGTQEVASLRSLTEEGVVPGDGRAQVSDLEQKGKMVGQRPEPLAVSSSVGLVGLASWAVFSGFRSAGWFCLWTLEWRSEVVVPVVRRCFSHGCSVSLAVTHGCSFPTSWRSGMLGACVLLPHVFDSAGSTGVIFGLTQSSFASALLEFLLLWLVRDWSSDPWVAARPSGSLAGVREGSFPTKPVTCEAHPYSFQVKESRRLLILHLVPSRTVAEQGETEDDTYTQEDGNDQE